MPIASFCLFLHWQTIWLFSLHFCRLLEFCCIDDMLQPFACACPVQHVRPFACICATDAQRATCARRVRDNLFVSCIATTHPGNENSLPGNENAFPDYENALPGNGNGFPGSETSFPGNENAHWERKRRTQQQQRPPRQRKRLRGNSTTPVRHSRDTRQTLARHSRDTRATPARHPRDTSATSVRFHRILWDSLGFSKSRLDYHGFLGLFTIL